MILFLTFYKLFLSIASAFQICALYFNKKAYEYSVLYCVTKSIPNIETKIVARLSKRECIWSVSPREERNPRGFSSFSRATPRRPWNVERKQEQRRESMFNSMEFRRSWPRSVNFNGILLGTSSNPAAVQPTSYRLVVGYSLKRDRE